MNSPHPEVRSSGASDEILRDVTRRHPLPVGAMAILTRRCNLSCVHCVQAKRDGAELTTADWGRVLGRLADDGVLFLTLSGGEPTVRDDFLEIVRIARSLSFAVRIKTNGYRLDAAACDALSSSSVLGVQISVYSADAEKHDRVTGVPGSHSRVVAAAKRLRDGGTQVLLVCPLMKETFEDYERLIEFAERNGFRYQFSPAIHVREDGCPGAVDRRIGDDQLRRLLSDRRLFGALRGQGFEKRGLDVPVCGVGRESCSIGPNGDVFPCSRIAEGLGNILSRPLREIWIGNEMLERYRSMCWRDLPACRGCEQRRYCVRCPADARDEDGDILGPSREACRMARIRADLAVEAAAPAGAGPSLAGPEPSGILPGVIAEDRDPGGQADPRGPARTRPRT